jgi:hypothetical protein
VITGLPSFQIVYIQMRRLWGAVLDSHLAPDDVLSC